MNEENNVKKKKIVKGAICVGVGLAITIGGVAGYNYKKNKDEIAQLEIEEQQRQAEEEKEKAVKEAEEKAQKEIKEVTEKAEKEIQEMKEEAEKQTELAKQNNTAVETSNNNAININNTIYIADVEQFLSLRAAASEKSETLALLNPFTEMTILENTNNTMALVRIHSYMHAGLTGYVNKNYLLPKGTLATRAKTKFVVGGTSEYLPLRSQPAFDDSNIIGKLPNGSTVILIEKVDVDFWKVKDATTGTIGYVAHNYLG